MIDQTEFFESFMSSSATVFAIFETESEQVDNNINEQLENMKAKVVKMCLYVWLVALFVG